MTEEQLQAFEIWKRVSDLFRSEANVLADKIRDYVETEFGEHTTVSTEVTEIKWGDWAIMEASVDERSVYYCVQWITHEKSFETEVAAFVHPAKTYIQGAGYFTRFLMDMSIEKEKNDK